MKSLKVLEVFKGQIVATLYFNFTNKLDLKLEKVKTS